VAALIGPSGIETPLLGATGQVLQGFNWSFGN